MDVQQTRAWHSSLYIESKDASIRDFKLELFKFLKFIHHWTLKPFTSNTPYLSHSFIKLSHFCDIESARWKVTNVLQALEGPMCEDSTSFEFLNVHSSTYVP